MPNPESEMQWSLQDWTRPWATAAVSTPMGMPVSKLKRKIGTTSASVTRPPACQQYGQPYLIPGISNKMIPALQMVLLIKCALVHSSLAIEPT